MTFDFPRATLAPSLLAAVLLGGCAPSDLTCASLTTRRLDLLNESGAVVARLGIDEDGSAGLFLLDADGRNRAALIQDGAQTALYLLDGDGAIRVGVAQYAHGGGGVALHGEESRGAAVLYLKDGAGSLRFYDAEGAVVQQVPAPSSPSGRPDDR